MTSRVDKVMLNHVYNSESSDDLRNLYSDFRYDEHNDSLVSTSECEQFGGYNKMKRQDIKYAPKGGFPPIFIIDKDQTKEKDDSKTKTRQFITKKTGISILDILKKRKAANK